jgi:hypothetical protein
MPSALRPCRDAGEASSLGDLLEDAPDDRGFLGDDLPGDVICAPHVAVAAHLAPRHVAVTGLAEHGVARPLAGLFALHLGRERREVHHNLLQRRAQCPLPVLQVVEDSHARVGDLLECPTRLDRLAPES